jgi:transposase
VVAAATGAVIQQVTVPATPAGYQQLLELAGRQSSRRIWAVESTGGYGAGLTRSLAAHHERVVELDRPKRAARRHGAKSDPLDATRAAREALGRDQLAQPRATGPRAALSVRLAARRSAVQAAGDAQRQLHALVVAAPDVLRERLRARSTRQLVAACARLRVHADWDVETSSTAATLRSLARRIRELTAEAADHRQAILGLVQAWRPDLLARAGSARSWPPPCSARGPTQAAAALMLPSPCWAGPPPSRPPAARPSGSGSTAPATASSTRPCTPWS